MASDNIAESAVFIISRLRGAKHSPEAIIAILDAARYVTMREIERNCKQDLADVFAHEAEDPEEHEIARWEGEGGAVNG